jgi:hypothetical protein
MPTGVDGETPPGFQFPDKELVASLLLKRGVILTPLFFCLYRKTNIILLLKIYYLLQK